MRSFGSDNHCGVHPELMKALITADQEHAPSYGTDIYSEKLNEKIAALFGKKARALAVFNGTGANVLALRSLASTPATVICSEVAHIHVDECGAPEHIGGFKLWPLPQHQGKLRLQDLESVLIRSGDQHFSQFRILSLTQPTELGTVYSLAELKALTQWARQHKLKIHIDGARIANALHFLNLNWQEFSDQVDFDALSLGGTKNGFLMGELVVYKTDEHTQGINYLRKQSLQLPSKTRYIAAQFLRYLEGDLSKQIASHSHQMAQRLRDKILSTSRRCHITQEVESNAVFMTIPKAFTKALKQSRFFYVWDEKTWECRLMTHWDTTENDIQDFIQTLKTLEESL